MDRPPGYSNPIWPIMRMAPAGCTFLAVLWLAPGPMRAAVDFEDEVLPILQENCRPCHDRHTRTSGFSVANLEAVLSGGARHGTAVKQGLPQRSPLMKVLRGEIKPQMPPGKTLPGEQLELIEQWIRELPAETQVRSKAEKYWAYVKPARRQPPAVNNVSWSHNGIDRFILQTSGERGALSCSPGPSAHPHPEAFLRPARRAAGAGRGRRFCRSSVSHSLRRIGGPSSGRPALRGTVGAPLAGPRPLC